MTAKEIEEGNTDAKTSLVQLVQLVQKGQVDSRFISYISWGQICTLSAVTAIAVYGFDELSKAFLTNIPLNGLIVSIMAIGVGRSIWSNILLWRTSRYLAALDAAVASPEVINTKLVARFKQQLPVRAPVLDTKQMYDLLGNLTDYGHLNITDNDARMVKSKLGFRVSMMRNQTGFLAGLLVMLGLLGTFWGLLATIDAVGDAMGSMSNINDFGVEMMSNFLAGIAAPLEGMGLAFSSSLFGLSGSLLIGFYSFLCGGVHNIFIERVSRWVDERIPTPTGAMRKAQKDPAVAGSDELKAWLAGFVQSTMQTNRQIADLIASINALNRYSSTLETQSRAIHDAQQHLQEDFSELRLGFAKSVHVIRKEVNDRFYELVRRTGGGQTPTLPTADPAADPAHETPQDTASRDTTERRIDALIDELRSLTDENSLVEELSERLQQPVDSDFMPVSRNASPDQSSKLQ